MSGEQRVAALDPEDGIHLVTHEGTLILHGVGASQPVIGALIVAASMDPQGSGRRQASFGLRGDIIATLEALGYFLANNRAACDIVQGVIAIHTSGTLSGDPPAPQEGPT
jgi:hypothetical protein